MKFKIQNSKIKIMVVLSSFLWALIIVNPAFAHKVNIFAYAEGDTVYTESYFPDGTKVEDGTVEVYDSQGNKLLEGKTNKEGQFNFKPPKRDDLKIIINASMGHRNSYTLSRNELPEILTPQESRGIVPKIGVKQTAEVNLDQIKSVIGSCLDEKLRPIMRELKKSEQKEVSFTEVIGGIGYIFGVMGIILYFLAKRRRD